ncbi:MAG: hypothetical protein GF344_04900 [Chitinivibrionales bacterium]|nr:hypothetical protein [Chitinivibrionales bacterium]MBD3356338.1 hypothetical protein [Chitinivibrionales bacterium]
MFQHKDDHSSTFLLGRIGAPLIMLTMLLLAAGLVPLSHPRMTRKAEREVANFVEGSVELGSAVVTLLRGVTLRDLRITYPLDDGRRLMLFVHDLHIGYRPLRLLSNRTDLRLRLKRLADSLNAKIALNPAVAVGELFAAPDADALAVARTVSIKDLSFAITGSETANVFGEDLDIRCRISRGFPLKAQGGLRGKGLSVLGYRLDRPYLTFNASHSLLRIHRIDARLYDGRFRAGLIFHLTDNAIRDGNLRLQGVDLEKLYRSRPREIGRIAGIADLRLKFKPCILHQDSIFGSGYFEGRNITLDGIPILKTAVVASSFPFLKRTDFEHIRGPITLTPQGVQCDSLEGWGSSLDMDVNGLVRFNADFDFEVLGTLNSAYTDSVPPLIWQAMLPDSSGNRCFACRISGTFHHPFVSIDRAVRRRAVRGAIRSFGRNLRSALGRGD